MAPLRPKFYYLSPTSQILPDGPIKLGSLIAQPRLVAEPINDVPVPPKSFAEKVYVHNAQYHSVTVDRKRSGHVGIFVEFLQNLGISGKIGGEASTDESEEWTFDTLQTIWFTPTTEYVKKSLEDTDVQDLIYENKTWMGRKKLYMVTGIKVAYGASSTVAYLQEKDLNLHAGVDFTPLGVPITVGPDIGIQQTVAVTQSQDRADAFVFAFRLRQVKISSAGDAQHQDFNKGALLCLDGHKGSDGKDEVQIVVDGLEDFDADASEFMLESWDTVDEAPFEETGCKYVKIS